MYLGDTLNDRKQFSRAVALYKRAVKLDRCVVQGGVALRGGAKVLTAPLPTHCRRNPDIRLHLGDALLNLGKPEQALRQYRCVCVCVLSCTVLPPLLVLYPALSSIHRHCTPFLQARTAAERAAPRTAGGTAEGKRSHSVLRAVQVCSHSPHCVHAGLTSNMFVARLRHACGHGDCCVCAIKCSCGQTLGSFLAPYTESLSATARACPPRCHPTMPSPCPCRLLCTEACPQHGPRASLPRWSEPRVAPSRVARPLPHPRQHRSRIMAAVTMVLVTLRTTLTVAVAWRMTIAYKRTRHLQSQAC